MAGVFQVQSLGIVLGKEIIQAQDLNTRPRGDRRLGGRALWQPPKRGLSLLN